MEAVNHDFRSIFGARSFMTRDVRRSRSCQPDSASVVGAGHPPLLIARHNGADEIDRFDCASVGLDRTPEFTETIDRS